MVTISEAEARERVEKCPLSEVLASLGLSLTKPESASTEEALIRAEFSVLKSEASAAK